MKLNNFTHVFKTKAFKKGTVSVVITAVAVLAAIGINYAVNLVPSRYTRIDTTGEKLFTMSEQSNALLSGISSDITIYHLCTNGVQDDKISELLMKYSSLSDKITVSVIDTSLYPNFYTDFASQSPSDNSLIVVSDKRNTVIDYEDIYTSSSDEYAYYGYYDQFNGESTVTSAIDYVSSDSLPVIYALEGHEEDDLPDDLQKEITLQNFDIQQLSLNGLEAIPEDASCVLIYSPARDISETEKNMLLSYQSSGGKVMLLMDYMTDETPQIDSFLQNYGLSLEKGMVFEGDSSKHISKYPYFIYPSLVSHEITDPLISGKLSVIFPLAKGIIISDATDSAYEISTLIASSESAYSKIDINSSNTAKAAGDAAGPFSFGVSVQDTSAKKLVLFSSSQFLDSNVNSNVAGANYDLFINSLGWLCEKESSVSIHPKSLLSTGITVSSFAASILFVIFVIAIPGLFILYAVFVIRKRKRR